MELNEADTCSLCLLHCLDVGNHCATSRDVKGDFNSRLAVYRKITMQEVDASLFKRNE